MKTIIRFIQSIGNIWWKEMKYILLDEGMVLFVFLLPLAYPILYSWIYNNEVVRDVPVVVVDDSHSSLSRKFINMFNASPNVEVKYYAQNINEAKNIIGHEKAYGALYFPEDFATNINRLEQSHVGVYCDMSLMLAYKNVYQTAASISGLMGAGIQTKLLGNYTHNEDVIAAQPLAYEEVSIFNTTGGYGNFILPGVLILILQQTLLLGMGLCSGTIREKYGRIVMRDSLYKHTVPVVTAKYLAYMMQYLILAAYILLVVPKLFSFVNIIYAKDFILFVIPYITACIFFAMTAMSIIRQREDVLLIVVFMSVPLLFIAGVSWPNCAMPEFWKYLGYIFPSTFGIKSFIEMSCMGARIEDIEPYIWAMWIQALIYLGTTLLIYRRELNPSLTPEKKIQ